jgi:hypothetical protein
MDFRQIPDVAGTRAGMTSKEKANQLHTVFFFLNPSCWLVQHPSFFKKDSGQAGMTAKKKSSSRKDTRRWIPDKSPT